MDKKNLSGFPGKNFGSQEKYGKKIERSFEKFLPESRIILCRITPPWREP
jgi:hypothetical protein